MPRLRGLRDPRLRPVVHARARRAAREDRFRDRHRLRREHGTRIATAHLTHLNPLPRNTGDVVRSFKHVLIPEMNMGQLVKLLRAEFLIDCESYTKVDGLPIFTRDVMDEILRRTGP